MMTDQPTIADLCAPPSAVDGKQRGRSHEAHARLCKTQKRGPANIIDRLVPERKVLPLHHEGKTIRQIAVETDIPAWIVIRTLRKHGLIR